MAVVQFEAFLKGALFSGAYGSCSQWQRALSCLQHMRIKDLQYLDSGSFLWLWHSSTYSKKESPLQKVHGTVSVRIPRIAQRFVCSLHSQQLGIFQAKCRQLQLSNECLWKRKPLGSCHVGTSECCQWQLATGDLWCFFQDTSHNKSQYNVAVQVIMAKS